MKFWNRKQKQKQAILQRRFESATVERLTADWILSTFSISDEIKQDLETLRNRSRDLEQNSDIARRYLSLVETNIVGKGFQLLVPAELADLKFKFEQWANSADIRGILSWPDLQRYIVRSVARDGEIFVQLVRDTSRPSGLALNIIEADAIEHSRNETWNRIYNGVELSETGEPIAYHYKSGATYKRIPASDMIQISRFGRIGQTRGFPWLAGSMRSIRMLDKYQESELVASRLASCKSGFYQQSLPGREFVADGATQSGAPITDAAPGVFEILPPGWDFKSYDPNHPTTQYGDFVRAILRQIAGGLNVSYGSLSGDYSDSNYSSSRIGLDLEKEHFLTLQSWFSNCFLSAVFSEWLRMANAVGEISVQEKQMAETSAAWIGKRFPYINPCDDLAAIEKEINLGLKSPSQAAAEKGESYSQIQTQIRADKELSAVGGATDLQTTALNGAQISSMVQVLTAAAKGELPAESVAPILSASFPSLSKDEINAISKPLLNFKVADEPDAKG